jgi:hypothetical protein
LTTKILAAIGVTVAIVIAIYTYFVHRVQSEWWRERTQAQNVITSTMVHEYLAGVMLSDRHQEVLHFLQELHNKNEIWRGRVIDINNNIVFSTTTQEMKRATLPTPAELFKEKRIVHGVRVEDGQRLAVAMSPIQNRASCARCHDAKQELLGAIVLERSLEPAVNTVARNRNLPLLYGALILVIVGAVVWLLIVRLIAQPVNNVLTGMERVRAGRNLQRPGDGRVFIRFLADEFVVHPQHRLPFALLVAVKTDDGFRVLSAADDFPLRHCFEVVEHLPRFQALRERALALGKFQQTPLSSRCLAEQS